MAIPSGFMTMHNVDSPIRVEPLSQPRGRPPRLTRKAANLPSLLIMKFISYNVTFYY